MTKKIRKKSGHLITSRQKGRADRIVVLLVVTVFFLFTLCSLYALVLQPTNPAAWAMIVFFLAGLFLILAHEENAFPDIPRRKLPVAIVTWIFAWIFIAYLISFLITLQLGQMSMAFIFGIVVVLGAAYVFMTETQWINFKTNVKSKTGGRIKKAVGKTKTGKKLASRKKRRAKLKEARKKNRRIRGW